MRGEHCAPGRAGRLGAGRRSNLHFTVGRSQSNYGDVVNAAIAFVMIAAAVFFVVVYPIRRLERQRPQAAPSMRACPERQSEIPIVATRRAFWTVELPPAALI